MRTFVVLTACILLARARPEPSAKPDSSWLEETDPTRSRSSYEYEDLAPDFPPGVVVLGTRIGWRNGPDPNNYWVDGQQVEFHELAKVQIDDPAKVPAKVLAKLEGEDSNAIDTI